MQVEVGIVLGQKSADDRFGNAGSSLVKHDQVKHLCTRVYR